jgi:hypothetical protein
MHKYLFSTISLAIVASLASCGGGGGGGGGGAANSNNTSSLSGKVIDGYIKGATACLDLNLNNTCDSGEPSSITDASGSYKLTYSSDVVIENIPVVVNVPAGAIDQSDGTISKAYTLSAPSGHAIVISPFTTLALYKIKFTPNMTYGQAAQAVADQLMSQGASFDPAKDFIEEGDTATQNAARATVALLQSSGLNASATQANLQAFLTAVEAPAKYGYAHPAASFKQIQAEVSKVLQNTLTVASLPITGASYATTPTAIASDKGGNLYVVDGTRVLKVNQSTGASTVYANGLSNPTGLALDEANNLYITDQNSIVKVASTGEKSSLVGSATSGFVDGNGAASRFNAPNALSVGSDGFLYVADTGNDAIRKVDLSTATVSTLDLSAFNTGLYTATDQPRAIAATANGIYFAGATGIHRWDGTRVTSYLFMSNGVLTFTIVGGLASSNTGDVYFTDSLRAKVYKLLDNPVLSTTTSPYLAAQIAGNSTSGSSDGPASTATFSIPMMGISVASDGGIFIADSGNRKIRTIR